MVCPPKRDCSPEGHESLVLYVFFGDTMYCQVLCSSAVFCGGFGFVFLFMALETCCEGPEGRIFAIVHITQEGRIFLPYPCNRGEYEAYPNICASYFCFLQRIVHMALRFKELGVQYPRDGNVISCSRRVEALYDRGIAFGETTF